MSAIRGPFLEYDCTVCGRAVQEHAPSNHDQLVERVAKMNADAKVRVCASCYDKDAIEKLR